MSAAEFVEFWRSVRLVAMATVGPGGQPHIAPVHAELAETALRLVVYENTVRRQDLAANPRVAFTTWRADGAVAILYGRAREVPGSLRPARPGPSGGPRRLVTIEVQLTRIYAMRAPERESNRTAQAWIRLGDPALVADLRDFFRAWGCVNIEASGDTVQVLLADAPSEREAQREIRTTSTPGSRSIPASRPRSSPDPHDRPCLIVEGGREGELPERARSQDRTSVVARASSARSNASDGQVSVASQYLRRLSLVL